MAMQCREEQLLHNIVRCGNMLFPADGIKHPIEPRYADKRLKYDMAAVEVLRRQTMRPPLRQAAAIELQFAICNIVN